MNDSHMDPLVRSAALRQEADFVLRAVRLYEILGPYGRIVPTGSYYLDVMMYPDIDLYISKVSVEELFTIGGQFATCEMVYQVVFEKSKEARLPGGLYLKPRIEHGQWGRPWKIDIWSLDDKVIDEKMADMLRFKQGMTVAVKERILRYKYSILTESRRTPMYSGYYVCKAFIDEGLTDFEEVTRYLVEHGIRMERTL
jgi:hypothetical protein